MKKTPVIERFKSKVAVDRESGCHQWIAARDPAGYGRILIGRVNSSAARVCWELTYGPIPQGMQVCHHCDNPACVNPEHLFLGTHTDNAQDKLRKGRANMPYGENHTKTKLTVAIVRSIRKSTRTHAELARFYRVTPRAIAAIREGVNWRHVQ